MIYTTLTTTSILSLIFRLAFFIRFSHFLITFHFAYRFSICITYRKIGIEICEMVVPEAKELADILKLQVTVLHQTVHPLLYLRLEELEKMIRIAQNSCRLFCDIGHT